jgi:hypothetical protein
MRSESPSAINTPGVASSIAEFIVSGENYRRDSNDQLPELGVRVAHGEFPLVGATGPLVPKSVPGTVKSNLTFSTLLNVLLHIVICTRLPANFVLDPAFASLWGRRTGSRESDSFGLSKVGFNDPGS